ncbi:hypothetical protein HSIEG1_2468 [Enterococcus sp. HSIEG1]|nr:hypothetical protein HSIEG1_2468 [Enterococcus sp. HSIEG1]
MSLENKIFEELVERTETINELILGKKEEDYPIWESSVLNEAIDFLIIKISNNPFLILILQKRH